MAGDSGLSKGAEVQWDIHVLATMQSLGQDLIGFGRKILKGTVLSGLAYR